MASAWGKSWGSAWGAAWGAIAAPASDPGYIGGTFNIPSRAQLRELARKQRIALGILPKPIQQKAKDAAKKIAEVVSGGGTEKEVKAALKVIPKAQRVEAMSAVQVAFAYYLAIQQQAKAQHEIARIQENQKRIAEILAEIERISIIQREEDDIAFMLMQVVMAE